MVARGPITITLSGEPVGKGRPRFARTTGHAYTPARTRAFEAALKYAAQQVMCDAAPLDGPIIALVIAIFPIPASWSAKKRAAALACEIWPTVRPDWDNLAKMLDALNGIVFRDDVIVVDGRVIKRYGERPRLVVEIREVPSYSADCGATASNSPSERERVRDLGGDQFHAPTLKDRSSGDVVLSQTMDPSAEAPNVDRSSRPLLASSGGTDWP